MNEVRSSIHAIVWYTNYPLTLQETISTGHIIMVVRASDSMQSSKHLT